MNSLRRFATKEPTVCAVCQRRAWSIGYKPHHRAPILWLCDDTDCISLGKTVYNMPQDKLDLFELSAHCDAADEAGWYLDELGTTDLAKLDRDQYLTVFARYRIAREKHLKAKLSHAA